MNLSTRVKHKNYHSSHISLDLLLQNSQIPLIFSSITNMLFKFSILIWVSKKKFKQLHNKQSTQLQDVNKNEQLEVCSLETSRHLSAFVFSTGIFIMENNNYLFSVKFGSLNIIQQSF